MSLSPQSTRLIQEARELNRRIEGLCERAAVQLFDQLTEMESVADLLTRAADLARGDGQARFRRSIEESGEHLDGIAARYAGLADVSRGLKQNVGRIGNLLVDLKRDIRLASMVATNAQVISSSLAERSDALEHFARDVKDLLQQAADTTQTVTGQLAAADADLSAVTGGIARMTTAAAALETLRRGLPPLLASLADLQGLARAVDSAAQAHGRIVRALRRAVTDLQGGDSARQRLEHVIQMLDRRDLDPAAARQSVEGLAQAQIAGAAQTLGAELTSALAALRDITDARAAAARALSALDATGVGRTLAAIAALLERLGGGLEDLDHLAEGLAPEIAALAETYARGATAVEAISGLDAEMHGLGMNAILVARKIGNHGQAMTEVARQLRECTKRIGEDSVQVLALARSQEQLTARFAAGAEERTRTAHERLRALEAEATDLARTFDGALSFLGAATPLDSIARGLSDLAALTHQAAARPSMSRKAPNGAAPSEEVLSQIRASYTMQSEREIHDRIFPSAGSTPGNVVPFPATKSAAAPTAAAPVADDGFDDIFF